MSAEDKKGIDFEALVESLKDLDFENVGGWPQPLKFAAAGIVFVLVIVMGYFFVITEANERLNGLRSQEQTLMQSYETKAFKAQNLDQYRLQLEDMKDLFESLLKQLPQETQVPGLLDDITNKAVGSGLDLKEIKLGQESPQQFYIELPIQIKVVGEYHAFGSFVSGVVALPRIVTLQDFSIKPIQKTNLLEMNVLAKTYRYASGAAGGR